MIKEIEIKVPTSYEDISLRKYLELQKELKNYEGDEEATIALLLYHLCGLDPQYLEGMGYNDLAVIKSDLEQFINKTDFELKKFVMVDGIEYGFEPNLSQMQYGAYLDITKNDTITIDDNWAKIMSILYRPVVRKKGDMYEIERYNGKIDGEKWLEVSMDIHFGTLFFFLYLSLDLARGIAKYTKVEEMPHNMQQILDVSGEVIHQLLNSQEEILQSSKKLRNNP